MTAAATLDLVARDRGLLWHPYAPLDGPPPYAVLAAEGVRLRLAAADGTHYEAIDAMSSWWSAIHGYRNPVLDAAARDQLDRFSHVMFGGLTHEPAIRLAEELVALTPDPLRHVFLADSGSVSVEVALKLAVQYQSAVGRPRRRRLVALRGGYHGDTTGAMGVCDPEDGMHALFPGLVSEHVFLPRPPAATLADGRFAPDQDCAEWISVAAATVEEHADTVAAIVVEPVLQGAGGMHPYPPQCVAALREIADRHGILLVADEIATGFGRTGLPFGVDHAGVVPDVMCVGKALTGGYLTLAAVLTTGPVAEAVGALLHGPTFMANPLACAVASASLSLLPAPRVGSIGEELARALAPAACLASVGDVRVLGATGAVQLTGPVDVGAVTRAALERGVWVRPFRDLVYTMPPYVCTSAEIAAIGSALVGAVAEVHG
jgi:adenosylmethionine-8-amino-7-oxononanoate aminotransferase